MRYLASTWSPSMLDGGTKATIKELTDLGPIKTALNHGAVTSAVGHEVTAKILSALLGMPIEFNRINLSLKHGDIVLLL